MMKKKSKQQEESKEVNTDKPIENKDNSHEPENSAGNNQDNSISGDTAGPTVETAKETTAASDKVVSETKSVEEKLSDMQDKYLRLSAEFDNYRRRTLREKIELSKYASEEILLKIIPLMDDFDRALALMGTATDCVAMKGGIDLIYNKFSEFLKQNGIKEIESLNSSFNVDLHDAVAKVPVEEEVRKGKVVDIVQKGYYLNDKVLRHSKVVVGE
jgi:molecular chaperone GrpE